MQCADLAKPTYSDSRVSYVKLPFSIWSRGQTLIPGAPFTTNIVPAEAPWSVFLRIPPTVPQRYEDMGFFSSRKAEDNESYQLAIGVGRGATDKSSVVQVIRSRFVRCYFSASIITPWLISFCPSSYPSFISFLVAFSSAQCAS